MRLRVYTHTVRTADIVVVIVVARGRRDVNNFFLLPPFFPFDFGWKT